MYRGIDKKQNIGPVIALKHLDSKIQERGRRGWGAGGKASQHSAHIQGKSRVPKIFWKRCILWWSEREHERAHCMHGGEGGRKVIPGPGADKEKGSSLFREQEMLGGSSEGRTQGHGRDILGHEGRRGSKTMEEMRRLCWSWEPEQRYNKRTPKDLSSDFGHRVLYRNAAELLKER